MKKTFMLVCVVALLIFSWATGNKVQAATALYLPFGSEAGSVRVARTGKAYEAEYLAAGLTYRDSEYHFPDSTNNYIRAAIDFSLPAGTAILSIASGTVVRPADICQVAIKHDDGTVAYYSHVNSIAVSIGQSVSRGQKVALVAPGSCGNSTGPHLHFALFSGGREIKAYFENAQSIDSITGKSCPQKLICPSLTKVHEFRYSAGATTTPTGRIRFVNGRSTPSVDNNGGRANVQVCADNLPNNTVYVIFWRSGREWRYSQRATGSCVTFFDMDGAGPLLLNTTYYSAVSLNDWPSKSWGTPCATATNSEGLCDSYRR